MSVLICLILYLLPIVLVCYSVYRDMKPGETVEDYIYRKDLEDCFWVLFIPGINILGLIIRFGAMLVCFVAQIRKPYDSENKKNK